MLQTYYPGVFQKYERVWQFWEGQESLHVKPIASLFFSIAINAPLKGSKFMHVYTWPHKDHHNIAAGVCTVYVYGKSQTGIRLYSLSRNISGCFAHGECTWLVNLEAVIILQIPPGSFVMFPSALITHFNIDCEGKKTNQAHEG
jgi:hypothetical protein